MTTTAELQPENSPRTSGQRSKQSPVGPVPKTKVLIFSASNSTFLPSLGGIQMVLKWLLDNLDRTLGNNQYFQVSVVYPHEASAEFARFENIPAFNAQLSAPSETRKLAKILALVKAIPRLGSLLKRINPDVVHCHRIVPDGLLALLAARMSGVKPRFILTSHGLGFLPYDPKISHTLNPLTRFLALRVAKRVALHVVPSQAVYERALADHVPRSKLIVIPNGIPNADEIDFEEEVRHFPGDSGLPDPRLHRENGLNFLCLSSGQAVKNIGTLIEAFALAQPELGNSRLFLSCIGPLESQMRHQVAERELNQCVHFVGHVKGAEKRTYFCASHVYCLPSIWENCPISLLEALKFRCAVVATPVGGIPDIVVDGANGLLVPPSDAKEMASALVKLFKNDDLRRRLVDAGTQTARKHSVSEAIEKHLQIWRGR